jgi:hypothetical protein
VDRANATERVPREPLGTTARNSDRRPHRQFRGRVVAARLDVI